MDLRRFTLTLSASILFAWVFISNQAAHASVAESAAEAPTPAAGSAEEYLQQHPGGVIVGGNEVVYPDGSGYVSLDVGEFSITQCSGGKFCMWTSANYSGSFTYVTGSGVTKTLTGTVKSFWNNRGSKAARLYNNAGTASTCYAAGAKKASVAIAYQSPAKVYLVKSVGVVYEVDPSVGRVGQAMRAWSSGSVTSSAGTASTACERARTSSPR